jgi:hypothetical protein
MKPEGTLFSVFREVEVPHGLYGAVLARIARARQQSARMKTLFLGLSSIIFGVALVPAFQYAGQELYSSGFYAYTSLFFSDGGFVLSAWREVGLSLIESLPSVALLLLLGLGVALAWSLRRTFLNARVAFSF